jgi:hypothetical protein
MTSSFGWLDYSEAQRRQMLEIVDQFREKGTLDELGFGSIRDSFADRFFPGISTIQTRARYLLFVPWIYRAIEREKLPYSQVEARARRDQARLVTALQKGGEGDAQGVIGIQAGEALRRTPSSIYWTALRTFRLWRFPGNIAQYYAALHRAGSGGLAVRSDEGELIEQARIVGWDLDFPVEPLGLLESAALAMTSNEADYLRERITVEAPNTLLAYCAQTSRQISAVEYPWHLADRAGFPPVLKAHLVHAHRFSAVAYGAVLLYNLMLAEKAADSGPPDMENLAERRRDEIRAWADEDSRLVYGWQSTDFWKVVSDGGHRIGNHTRQFVEDMLVTIRENPLLFADSKRARELIEYRELFLKGGLARLRNPRALEQYSGSVGLFRQSYRWPNVKQIVGDIHMGLAHRRVPAESSGA